MNDKVRNWLLATPVGPAYGEWLRLGLIALSTDLAIERDFARLSNDSVSVFTTRVRMRTPNSAATFRELERELPAVASLLVPSSRLDVVAFGCTAASMLIGNEQIETAVRAGRPGVHVTNPARAVIAALEHLSAKRIALLTPYTPSITQVTVEYLAAHGIDVTDAIGLGIDMDDTHARIAEGDLVRAALSLDLSGADALFVSCTAIRSLNVIEALELATGLPVLSSNQATFWHALHLGGVKYTVCGYGQLLRTGPAPGRG